MGRAQHYVAQIYLRRFAMPQKPSMVWVLDKLGSIVRHTNTKNVCAESWFYQSDAALDGLEAWLAQREGRYDRAMNRLVSLEQGDSIPESIRRDLAEFAAIQHVRSKEARMALADSAMQLCEMSTGIELPWDLTDAEKRFRCHWQDVQASILTEDLEEIIEPFLSLSWTLVQQTAVAGTIHTSDCPVALYNNLPHDEKGFEAPGARGAQVYIPLSPYHCLVMSDRESYLERPAVAHCSDRWFFSFCNMLQTIKATRYVCSSRDDFESGQRSIHHMTEWVQGNRHRSRTTPLYETIAREPDGRLSMYVVSTSARRIRLGGQLTAFDQATLT